jgi:hypothetical protein
MSLYRRIIAVLWHFAKTQLSLTTINSIQWNLFFSLLELKIASSFLRIYIFMFTSYLACLNFKSMFPFPESQSFLSPISFVLEWSTSHIRALISNFRKFFFLSYHYIFGFYIQNHLIMHLKCCFPQMHSAKWCHLWFIILEMVSVFLCEPVAVCFL